MQQRVNKAYAPLFKEKPRYFILMGGRGAGRSTVASQYALAKLRSDEYFRCAIMRYILGDIRNSIYREITDRIDEMGVADDIHINSQPMALSYGGNSINAVGFRKSSSDQKSKLKSLANYNSVIIEEADEAPEPDFTQLDDSLRTLKGDTTILMMLNPPPKSHWIIERFFDLEPSGVPDFYIPRLKKEREADTVFIHTTFFDNLKNLSAQSIKNYQAYKTSKPDHYWNMVAGLVPEVVRGKIYSGWQQIDTIPHEARLERIGLDFGYTTDPTAIVAVYYYNGGYILDEIAFTPGLHNNQIAAILLNEEKVVVVADSAEPKSIDDIKRYGVPIIAAEKGSDSVRAGIEIVQQQKISVTKRSTNIWREYNNYAWYEDKENEGEFENEPKPGYDHSMDALRYAINSIKKPEKTGVSIHKPKRGGFGRR